ncbi:hypothetical protein BU16DRAFT_536139 [Lophium mytilinum]|uniref:F-box domain-containing protein n=1 Tax=Lophium mytilinum TaxID=390894 RepID=A0A6A6R7Y8_9PEZI|nr:hypothetical protein BU16DRAFT_536139 [Lophium mytilinum]
MSHDLVLGTSFLPVSFKKATYLQALHTYDNIFDDERLFFHHERLLVERLLFWEATTCVRSPPPSFPLPHCILYVSRPHDYPTKRRKKRKHSHWKPTGAFRFLDLPRELRDMVYDLALKQGIVLWKSKLVKDKGATLYGERLSLQGPAPHLKKFAILEICKQVSKEVKEALYPQLTFGLILASSSAWLHYSHYPCHFDVPGCYNPGPESFPPPYAGLLNHVRVTNHNWDIEHIQRLVMIFELNVKQTSPRFNPLDGHTDLGRSGPDPARFRALHYMRSLRELRVVIIYNGATPRALLKFFERESEHVPDKLQATMQSLIAATPKHVTIEWGWTKEKYMTAFRRPFRYLNDMRDPKRRFELVQEEVLKRLADGFPGLQRTEAEVFVKGERVVEDEDDDESEDEH